MGGESTAVVYADSTRAYRVREGTLSLERDEGDEKETSCLQARRIAIYTCSTGGLVNPRSVWGT